MVVQYLTWQHDLTGAAVVIHTNLLLLLPSPSFHDSATGVTEEFIENHQRWRITSKNCLT